MSRKRHTKNSQKLNVVEAVGLIIYSILLLNGKIWHYSVSCCYSIVCSNLCFENKNTITLLQHYWPCSCAEVAAAVTAAAAAAMPLQLHMKVCARRLRRYSVPFSCCRRYWVCASDERLPPFDSLCAESRNACIQHVRNPMNMKQLALPLRLPVYTAYM